MHNNYYFLRQLTSRLQTILAGTVASECFSQSKDELIIRFETHGDPFFIKAGLSGSFSCLSFPQKFNRARKNSVDLFSELIGRRVLGLRQFENERSFSINFSDQVGLLFKMHGNRSNVISLESNGVLGIFRNNIPEDANISPDNLDRKIDWSFEYFSRNHEQAQKVYFTFGKDVWGYLRGKGYDDQKVEKKWESIRHVTDMLLDPTYRICVGSGRTYFSLLPSNETTQEFEDPVQAVTTFAQRFSQQDSLTSEKSQLRSRLSSKLSALENGIQKLRDRLRELEVDSNYRLRADLIMANLHAIKAGTEHISLPDFFHENRVVDIKLKRDLTPQRNAELLYRKAKNQQIEADHLIRMLNIREGEKVEVITQLEELNNAFELKQLRQIAQGFADPEKEKKQVPVPYREVIYNGYKIWIGKNAQQNDVLTLKFGYKDDLWLHAKDVAGSHVLLKHQAGRNFPRDVIEKAAQLAAYYSKRKNESLCPVSVTQKKYVRKRKGDPAGVVVVEREDVMMVVPDKGEA